GFPFLPMTGTRRPILTKSSYAAIILSRSFIFFRSAVFAVVIGVSCLCRRGRESPAFLAISQPPELVLQLAPDAGLPDFKPWVQWTVWSWKVVVVGAISRDCVAHDLKGLCLPVLHVRDFWLQ